MLRGVRQALNSLSIHVTFTAMVPEAYSYPADARSVGDSHPSCYIAGRELRAKVAPSTSRLIVGLLMCRPLTDVTYRPIYDIFIVLNYVICNFYNTLHYRLLSKITENLEEKILCGEKTFASATLTLYVFDRALCMVMLIV